MDRPNIFFFLAPVLFLLIVLIYPLGSDNSVYQSMALDWIRYGKIPYLGSWDQNFPAIILLHALSILIFGPSDLGFRFLDLLIQIAGCYMLYRLCSLYFKPRTAWFAVMLYIFYYVHASSMVVGQRDVFATLLTITAVYLVLRSSFISRSQLALVGLLFGLAILFRPTYFLYEVAVILILPQLRNFRSAAIILLFSGIPCAIVVGLYSLIPNGLNELFLATIRFNTDLYTNFGWRWNWWWNGLFRTLIVVIPTFTLIVLPRRASITYREVNSSLIPRPVLRLYFTYIILTLLVILIQGKFLTYHFYTYVILLTPLAAIGFEMVLGYLRVRHRIPAFIAIGIIAVLPVYKIRYLASGEARNYDLKTRLYSSEYPGIPTGFISAMQAKNYLQPYVDRGERIEVATFDARLRASLGANSATRFTMLEAIGCRIDPNKTGENNYTSYQRVWRQEYMDSLRTVKPPFIVLARRTDFWYMLDPYNDVLHQLPGFDSLMAASYRYDTAFGAYQIYRHK